MEAIWIETAYRPVFALADGPADGPLVVGVHGWSRRNGAHVWEPLLPILAAAGCRALSLDMPGWGRSAAWEGGPEPGVEDVAVLEAILAGLSGGPVVFMGKSWGGGAALQYALLNQGHVPALILSAPAFRGRPESLAGAPPTLLIWAEDDPVIPVTLAALLAERIPQSELLLFPAGGHSAATHNGSDAGAAAVRFLRQQGFIPPPENVQ